MQESGLLAPTGCVAALGAATREGAHDGLQLGSQTGRGGHLFEVQQANIVSICPILDAAGGLVAEGALCGGLRLRQRSRSGASPHLRVDHSSS